jgi:phospholipase C
VLSAERPAFEAEVATLSPWTSFARFVAEGVWHIWHGFDHVLFLISLLLPYRPPYDWATMIRFLEARFAHHHGDLVESNITPWRRAVAGDLTTAFDFKTPNASRRIILPSTDDFKPQDLVRQPDEVPVPPAHQKLPGQESGVRPARALPYTLDAHGAVHDADDSFRIQFRNTGQAGAVFQVRSGNSADLPRTYTVEPHKHLTDSWSVAAIGASKYDLSVYGPNGFYRAFRGNVSGHHANLDVRAVYDEESHSIALTISNRASQIARVGVYNRYTSKSTKLVLAPGESESKSWSLSRTQGWYDLAITVEEDSQFRYHFAGHLENGEDSISDPIMGGLV